ncbi:Poly A polymerase [Macleaya cordata]|uniref:Poly A polymerase n=1 Tax=Macleaya cordata TaxID=56857 RepID=A0A200PQW9_MACCD|nr:Poly A polymerase [Macleaya cordata]
MISESSWIVLKLLQNKGFEAYLVGGCVRDLLLRRTPKDFDVITTAKLKQIKKQFHRSQIVGRRFPICQVHVKGSIIEVSSFDTVAKQDEKKKPVLFSQMPTGCNKKDFVRWRNSLGRDFTINSLFYDPFVNEIYDYANGMRDLSLCEVIVYYFCYSKSSFTRILRGLRIAARLGLSFSKQTATAIRNLSLSVMYLDKGRLMMEVNYMLSYGAAETSLCLLRRFKILDILLPFHVSGLLCSLTPLGVVLQKLFSSMDKLLACDRPCHCSLWVALLAFHLALVNNPQNALVIWAFSSVLYHGNWREAVKFARESAQLHVKFVPEILEACGTTTDAALIEDVTHLASLVRSSIDALTDPLSLYESMTQYSSFQCHGLVFISKMVGQNAAGLFDVLVSDIESFNNERESFEIDYELLGIGDKNEIRFVLGKVIMDAMSSRVTQEQHQQAVEEHHLPLSYFKKQLRVVKKKSFLPDEFDLKQHQDALKRVHDCKPVSKVVKQLRAVKERSILPEEFNLELKQDELKENDYKPELTNLEVQREPDKKGKCNQSVSNPEQQQQEVVREEVKCRKPLSSLFM